MRKVRKAGNLIEEAAGVIAPTWFAQPILGLSEHLPKGVARLRERVNLDQSLDACGCIPGEAERLGSGVPTAGEVRAGEIGSSGFLQENVARFDVVLAQLNHAIGCLVILGDCPIFFADAPKEIAGFDVKV